MIQKVADVEKLKALAEKAKFHCKRGELHWFLETLAWSLNSRKNVMALKAIDDAFSEEKAWIEPLRDYLCIVKGRLNAIATKRYGDLWEIVASEMRGFDS